tara:strand:- start:19416 stop:20315 length:900 start_codon:yes stop_codon:yes gene_type:complete
MRNGFEARLTTFQDELLASIRSAMSKHDPPLDPDRRGDRTWSPQQASLTNNQHFIANQLGAMATATNQDFDAVAANFAKVHNELLSNSNQITKSTSETQALHTAFRTFAANRGAVVDNAAIDTKTEALKVSFRAEMNVVKTLQNGHFDALSQRFNRQDCSKDMKDVLLLLKNRPKEDSISDDTIEKLNRPVQDATSQLQDAKVLAAAVTLEFGKPWKSCRDPKPSKLQLGYLRRALDKAWSQLKQTVLLLRYVYTTQFMVLVAFSMHGNNNNCISKVDYLAYMTLYRLMVLLWVDDHSL